MKARMADPAFRAKAMENLARGRAARAAKRGRATSPAASREAPPAASDRSGEQTDRQDPPATRALGIGRWRTKN